VHTKSKLWLVKLNEERRLEASPGRRRTGVGAHRRQRKSTVVEEAEGLTAADLLILILNPGHILFASKANDTIYFLVFLFLKIQSGKLWK
jgi:hypothetical protein